MFFKEASQDVGMHSGATSEAKPTHHELDNYKKVRVLNSIVITICSVRSENLTSPKFRELINVNRVVVCFFEPSFWYASQV